MSLTDELDKAMASGVDLRAMLDPAASDEVRQSAGAGIMRAYGTFKSNFLQLCKTFGKTRRYFWGYS